MYLSKLSIENFRLIKSLDILLDKSLTVAVGKNNTGKTSVAQLIRMVLDKKEHISFDDYPLDCRKELYSIISDYWKGEKDLEATAKAIKCTRLIFTIDYSEDSNDFELGDLGSFIIDMDETIDYALIEAVYSVDMQKIEDILEKCKKHYLKLTVSESNPQDEKQYDFSNIDIIKNVIKEEFDNIFRLRVYAVNPSDKDDKDLRELKQLSQVFTYRVIDAERSLGESENPDEHPLTGIMKRVFSSTGQNFEATLQANIDRLKDVVDKSNFEAQKEVNGLMSNILSEMVKFGYPSAEDMNLQANTDISLKNQILHSTDLSYVNDGDTEMLPSTHNGLGYKNLIKIVFMLQDFKQEFSKDSTKIPLLLIEEPEAHMHPQLQARFIEFLNGFLDGNKERKVQVMVSTHSAHIANAVQFKQIRYMRRSLAGVVCKDLQDFYNLADKNGKKTHLEFLQKYFKLSYCDLYFCDKVILVEGAGERLLIPRMIQKCEKDNLFTLPAVKIADGKHGIANEGEELPVDNTEKTRSLPTLSSQYYTILEVGGAYAHRFYDLVDFLEIPTLIITDVDYVGSDTKKCQFVNAVRSSNGAITRWYKDSVINTSHITNTEDILIEHVKELMDNADAKTQGCRHIEFQVPEAGAHPRSLEEAIENVNRELYGVELVDGEIPLYKESSKSKTDFALQLLTDPKFEDFQVPKYIKDGLVWLNEQANIMK